VPVFGYDRSSEMESTLALAKFGSRVTAAITGVGVLAIAVGCWRVAKQRWSRELAKAKAEQFGIDSVVDVLNTTAMDKSSRHIDINNNTSTNSNNEGKNFNKKHSPEMRKEERGEGSRVRSRSQGHRRSRQGRGLNSSRHSRRSVNSNPGNKKNSPPCSHKPTSSLSTESHSLACVKGTKAGKCCLGQPLCLNTLIMSGRRNRNDRKDPVRQRLKSKTLQNTLESSDSEEEKRKTIVESSTHIVNDQYKNDNLTISSTRGGCRNELLSMPEDFIIDQNSNFSLANVYSRSDQEVSSSNNGTSSSCSSNSNDNNKNIASSIEGGDRRVDERDGCEDDEDEDLDFPSLCDIAFDNQEDIDDEGDDDGFNYCDYQAVSNVQVREKLTSGDIVSGGEPTPMTETASAPLLPSKKCDLLFEGSTSRRSSSPSSSGTSSGCDSYSYPIYLRPDILDLLNERAKKSLPPPDPWCVRSPVFQSTLRNLLGESALDVSVCELGACIFVNVMTMGLTEPPPSFVRRGPSTPNQVHLLGGNNNNNSIVYNANASSGSGIPTSNRSKSAHPTLLSDHPPTAATTTLPYKNGNNSLGWSPLSTKSVTSSGAFNESFTRPNVASSSQLVFSPQQKLRAPCRSVSSGTGRPFNNKQVYPIDELTELFSRTVRAASGITAAPSAPNPQPTTMGALSQVYCGTSVSTSANGCRLASTPPFGRSSYSLASTNGSVNNKSTHHQHQQQANQYAFPRNGGPPDGNPVIPPTNGSRLGAHLDVLAFPTPSPNSTNQYGSLHQSSFPGSPQQSGSFTWQSAYSHSQQQPQQHQQPQKPYSVRTNFSPFARYAVH
ncbi:hypothetical protein BIW11_05583, partial [Tropilaelaps mercedesae]